MSSPAADDSLTSAEQPSDDVSLAESLGTEQADTSEPDAATRLLDQSSHETMWQLIWKRFKQFFESCLQMIMGNSFKIPDQLGPTMATSEILELFDMVPEFREAYGVRQLMDDYGPSMRTTWWGGARAAWKTSKREKQILLIPNDHELKPYLLSKLGGSYYSRFLRLGGPADIDRAIELSCQAVSLTPDEHLAKPAWLSNLGNSYVGRFMRLGELGDLDKAIRCHTQAVFLVPSTDNAKPALLGNLGLSHSGRFHRLGEPADIDKAIEFHSQAVLLSPDEHPDNPGLLGNLGTSHALRFTSQGALGDIDKAIEYQSRAASLTPDEHTMKPMILGDLGVACRLRFQRLGELADVEQAIECHSRVMLLTARGHPYRPGALINLGDSHEARFQRLGDPSDIDKAIENKIQAVSYLPDGHPGKPQMLGSLGNSYGIRFQYLGELPDIEKAAECHARAVSLTPDGHAQKPGLLRDRGNSYDSRFQRLGDIVDVDKAIEVKIQAVSLAPEGHAGKPGLWFSLGISYLGRFYRLDDLADLDRAIETLIQAVSLPPDGHSSKPVLLATLGDSYAARFKRLRDTSDIDKAVSYKIQAVSLTPDGHTIKPAIMGSLGGAYGLRFKYLGQLSDNDEAIRFLDGAVSLIPNGYAARPAHLAGLGMALTLRFKRLKEIGDINRAVEYLDAAVSLTPDGDPSTPERLLNLGISQYNRFKQTHDRYDLVQSIGFFQQASNSTAGLPSVRLRASCKWAKLALKHNISSPLEAWKHAMALVPQNIWLGTTVGRRYEALATIGELAVGAAEVAIELHDYDLAVEWLEAGHSIVWNQILQLRTPVDEVKAVDPALAAQIEQVSAQLERASFEGHGMVSYEPNTVSPEQAAQKHRRLAEQWETLVDKARRTPGFSGFLRPKTIAQLVGAAHSGTVVVITVHKDQCSALMLLPNLSSVTHLSLPNFSRTKAERAYRRMAHLLHDTGARQSGDRKFTSKRVTTKSPFEDILAELWWEIVKPVLERLGYMPRKTNDLPRITWCTTGHLSFLPLHAAGLYGADASGSKIFNYAITSYTPTLSALLVPPASSTQTMRVLAVGQSATPGQSLLPGTIEELDRITDHVGAQYFTRLEGSKASAEAVLQAMESHSWVHLACHASQNSNAPGSSAFYLHDGPLELSTIMSKSLKHAEFAFLSACQTASGDESLPDEAVHLAAGMLVAGYRSVIATMWSIRDVDGPLIADRVYAHLAKDGSPNSRKTAEALHVAVECLREKVGEGDFMSWAPYIHMGL